MLRWCSDVTAVSACQFAGGTCRTMLTSVFLYRLVWIMIVAPVGWLSITVHCGQSCRSSSSGGGLGWSAAVDLGRRPARVAGATVDQMRVDGHGRAVRASDFRTADLPGAPDQRPDRPGSRPRRAPPAVPSAFAARCLRCRGLDKVCCGQATRCG